MSNKNESSMGLRIECMATGKTWSLRQNHRLVFGRAPLSDAIISSDPCLSSTHFEIQFVPGAAIVHDLNSTNGTFLNGDRVHWKTIRDGDEIRAGMSAFKVRFRTDTAANDVINVPLELGCNSTLLATSRD